MPCPMQQVCRRYQAVVPPKCTSQKEWETCPIYSEARREKAQRDWSRP
jgi:hypothetical protein